MRQQGDSLVVDFLKTRLPKTYSGNWMWVICNACPGCGYLCEGENVRMLIEPSGLWEHAAYQTDNKFIIEVKRIVEDPNKMVKGSKVGYNGEKLTLNFQKIDVREALNVIADFTELNVVISDTVKGNLTLRSRMCPGIRLLILFCKVAAWICARTAM